MAIVTLVAGADNLPCDCATDAGGPASPNVAKTYAKNRLMGVLIAEVSLGSPLAQA